VGRLLLKADASPHTSSALRAYGTRDMVIGGGVVGAVARGRDPSPFLAAGVASDALDTVAQVIDWKHLPPDRRAGGVAFAVGAGIAGRLLLRQVATTSEATTGR
jgi:hypothetical protein